MLHNLLSQVLLVFQVAIWPRELHVVQEQVFSSKGKPWAYRAYTPGRLQAVLSFCAYSERAIKALM